MKSSYTSISIKKFWNFHKFDCRIVMNGKKRLDCLRLTMPVSSEVKDSGVMNLALEHEVKLPRN